MLALLPLAAVLSLTLVLGNAFPAWGWRRAGLRALLAAGLYVVLTTEALSLLKLIRQIPLALVWAAAVLASIAWLLHWRRRHPIRFPRLQGPVSHADKALIAGIALVVAITALVAYLAPPQTWDSLNYHMPRVAHWAQQGSVDVFATGIEIQNSLPPGAEFAVLHLYVLAQSDLWVNYVSWLAIVGVIAAASLLARQLGAGRTGQLAASVFATTLPMGLVQASSTMNDGVAALWIILAASEALLLAADVRRWDAAACLAGGAALAALTKPTAYPCLLALAAMVAGMLAVRHPWRRALGYAAMAVVVVLAVNFGHLARMTSLYGSPMSPEQVDLHRNQLVTPAGVASNLIRHAALHAGTPWPKVNRATYEIVILAHQVLGVDPSDPRTTNHEAFKVPALNVYENKAGNPVHALMGLGAVAVLLARRKALPSVVHWYGLGLLLAALIFSAVFKWQIFASRYHLPFFALLAPWVAAIGSASFRPRWLHLASGLLLLASIPWLIGIRTRPLLPAWDDPKVDSMLTESRQNLLFASADYLKIPYTEMAALIRQESCTQVGVMLSGGGAEYPLWVLLGAPSQDLRIEWLVGGTPSERFADPDFTPCAIICQRCEGRSTTMRGLPVAYARSNFRLYLQDSH